MRFAAVWKYYGQQWFQNMIKQVLYVVTVLLSRQIDDMESIDSPNNGQHEFLRPDFLFHLLTDIISRCALFCRITKFQSEPPLVPSHKTLNFIFLMNLENGQSLSAGFHPNLSQTSR
jgi:hypothetical protein